MYSVKNILTCTYLLQTEAVGGFLATQHNVCCQNLKRTVCATQNMELVFSYFVYFYYFNTL